MRRATFLLFCGALAAIPRAGLADSADATTRADALFRSAKSLRAAGSYSEACAAFAESKRLAPGVGVSLYLADCYERLGKTAGAWAEFRDAETRARQRHDKRAAVARGRALALEPRLGHFGVVLSVTGAATGAELRVDGGEPVAAASWTPLAVDPGEHEIALRVAGEPDRSARAQVRAGRWAIVRFDAPGATSAPRRDEGTAAPAGADEIDARRILGYSLLAAGIAGVATGAGLLALKNGSMSTGAPGGSPTVSQSAAIGSDVAFGIGGAAFVSAVVLYLAAPTPKEAAFVIAPGPLTGGAGAFLSGRF